MLTFAIPFAGYPFPLVLKKKGSSNATSGRSTPGVTNGQRSAKVLLSEGDLAKADAALRGSQV